MSDLKLCEGCGDLAVCQCTDCNFHLADEHPEHYFCGSCCGHSQRYYKCSLIDQEVQMSKVINDLRDEIDRLKSLLRVSHAYGGQCQVGLQEVFGFLYCSTHRTTNCDANGCFAIEDVRKEIFKGRL